MELAPERIGECVHGCGVDRAETKATVEAGSRHAFASFGVVGIANGAWEEASAECDAFEGVEVDERMREAIGIGLDEMGEGVEAGVGSDCGRNRVRERGVDEGGVWDEM